MATNRCGRRPLRLSKLLIRWWIAALVAIFVLILGSRLHGEHQTYDWRAHAAHHSPISRYAVSADGRLQLSFPLAARGWIHKGTRITFRYRPIGRVVEVDPVEVDPGSEAILVKMVIRRDFVRKANAIPSKLMPYYSSSDPWGTALALVRG